MQNLTVHLGSANPTFFAGRPTRARALHRAADRPAPSVSGTAARHCPAAHLSVLSLPALSGRHARAWRTSSTSAVLGLLPGDDRRSGPGPTAPPHRVAPPRPGPPPFPSPFSLCRAAAEPLAPSSRVDSSSHPNSSPTPSLESPSFPTAPLTRTTASGHRRPRLPRGFRSSTAAVHHSPVSSSSRYQSPKFPANPSLPRLSQAAGLPHPRR
jgi:hypothetical protein